MKLREWQRDQLYFSRKWIGVTYNSIIQKCERISWYVISLIFYNLRQENVKIFLCSGTFSKNMYTISETNYIHSVQCKIDANVHIWNMNFTWLFQRHYIDETTLFIDINLIFILLSVAKYRLWKRQKYITYMMDF